MKKNPWFWAAAALLLGCLLYIFLPVMGYHVVLASPDSGPHYLVGHPTVLLRHFLMAGHGWLLHPARLPEFLLPPLVYHDLHYALCAVAVCLATMYYLRGLRLGWSAAFCGGFAMAFSGYHFTLISAGHRGYFDMMPWAILLLAWVDRAIRDPRPRYTASAVVALGFGLATQADVMALFVMLVVAYAVTLCVVSLRHADAFERRAWWKRFGRAVLPALPVLLLVGYTPLTHVFGILMPHRAAQIVETTAAARGDAEGGVAIDPEEAWVFATNWSLPPTEALEFVAPFFFGIETGHRAGAYWGALGRIPRWETFKTQVEEHVAYRVAPEDREAQRSTLLGRARNLRGHTTYLGGVQLLFGLLALAWAWSRRRSDHVGAGEANALASEHERTIPLATVTRFWSISALLALLLAFGRYTPVYRLFYALPYMSNLRAPVKFLHLTELSVAVLFAVGIHVAARLARERGRGKTLQARIGSVVVLTGAVVAAVLLLLGMFAPWAGIVRSELHAVGVPAREIPHLLNLSRRALVHGGLVLGLGSLALAVILRDRLPRFIPVGMPLLLILAVDVCIVCRPYIRPLDVLAIYEPNPVVEKILERSGNEPYRVTNRLADVSWYAPLWGALLHHRIPRTEPGGNDAEHMALTEALSERPEALWTLSGTRFIIGEARELDQLREHPHYTVLLGFDLDRRGRVGGLSDSGRCLLVEREGAETYAQVFYDWRLVGSGEAFPAVTARGAPIASRVWVEAEAGTDIPIAATSADAPVPARTLQTFDRSIMNRTVIEAETERPAMLLVRERNAAPATATVNGRPAPLLRANHLWRAVPLEEAGRYLVEIDYGRNPWRPATSLAAMLLLAGIWARVFGLWRRVVPSLRSCRINRQGA